MYGGVRKHGGLYSVVMEGNEGAKNEGERK